MLYRLALCAEAFFAIKLGRLISCVMRSSSPFCLRNASPFSHRGASSLMRSYEECLPSAIWPMGMCEDKAPMYYRNAGAAMIVYDITSRSSFQAMQSWVTELKRNVETHVVLVVLGNKCDLHDTRKVSLSEAVEYAAQIGAKHFETSALAHQGIEEVFVEICESLLRVEAQKRGSVVHSVDSLLFTPDNIRLEDSQQTAESSQPIEKQGCCT